MNLISLFSGIGGFEIAGEWMGWETIASVEINPFGQKTLKYYWPNAYHHENVKTVNYEEIKKRINRSKSTILVAGFPCQPFSTAGKRKGTEDDRYGWPDCITAVQSIQPEWCIFENVSGLISWNGGMVFDEVQADLEAAGYEVIPFVLPACGVNAPHRRDRVWFIAHRNDTGTNIGLRTDGIREAQNNGRKGFAQSESWKDGGNGSTPHQHNQRSATGLGEVQETNGEIPKWNDNAESGNAGINSTRHSQLTGLERRIGSSGAEGFKPGCEENDATNTGSIGQQGQGWDAQPGDTTEGGNGKADWANYDNERWERFPTQPPVRGRNDGLSPNLVGITVSKHRQESIKGYGNAVVPQLVFQVFKAIEQYEKLNLK